MMDPVHSQFMQAMLRVLFQKAVALYDEACDLSTADMIDYARSVEAQSYRDTVLLLRKEETLDNVVAMYAHTMRQPGSPCAPIPFQPLSFLWRNLKQIEADRIDEALAVIAAVHENIWAPEDRPKFSF